MHRQLKSEGFDADSRGHKDNRSLDFPARSSKTVAIALLIPADRLEQARPFRGGSESFNEMVVEAIAREMRRRRSHSAHQCIVARSTDVEAKTGIWADRRTVLLGNSL